MNSRVFAVLSLIGCLTISACSGGTKVDAENYPQDPDDARKAHRGKLTGEGGLVLVGENSIFSKKKKGGSGGGIGMAVNDLLWKATLETLSFMPMQSSDPIGGVIITDWYESPEAPGERFRVNVMILDSELRADAVKVNVFKQVKLDGHDWRDAKVEPKVARDMEDTILTKARALRIKRDSQ